MIFSDGFIIQLKRAVKKQIKDGWNINQIVSLYNVHS